MGKRKLFAGIDTHKDTHVLCILNEHAHIVFKGSFPANDEGYTQIEATLGDPDGCERIAIEGVTSYGYGIASYLSNKGYEIREALRPGARPYNPQGKTDEIDAYTAAYLSIFRLMSQGSQADGRRCPTSFFLDCCQGQRR